MAVEGGALGWVERVRRSSGPVRFHQYTRYTIYSFALFEGVALLAWVVAQAAGPAAWAAAVLGTLFAAHTVCHLLLSRAGLRYYLGTSARPVRLAAAYVVLTGTGVAAVLALIGAGELSAPRALPPVVWLLMFLAGPLPLVLSAGRSTALVAALLAVSMLTARGLGAAGGGLVAAVVGTVVGAVIFGVSYRCSAWTMRVVRELEAARETQARLAVAEERLRFGRDLHDVLGRNLSVIALKSELAVQLAQRGSPSAVDQMTEVQRIARESQREMREVVRGYREADLHTELVGARGVLRAAGIDCRIEDSGSGALAEPLQSALGWVVREGTTNVLRHADAGRCSVRLRTAGPVAELVMENDGVPGSGASTGGGSGLAGLRERLAALGGTLTGERRGDGTFRLTARIPTRPDRDGGGDGGEGGGEDGSGRGER
ncbi:sensor histidine kinase [Streptomyces radiopugnans]|uniref:sensor histidine kinase n=1 Tax=Streptomyces radiopugnans TaxID=403935 RepID=UPI0031836F5F